MTYPEVRKGVLDFARRKIQSGKRLSADDLETATKLSLEVLTSGTVDHAVVYDAGFVLGSTVSGAYHEIPEGCTNSLNCIAHYLIEVRAERGEVLEAVASQIREFKPGCACTCQVNPDGMKRPEPMPVDVGVFADTCGDTITFRRAV